jgi:hypothetical protein
MHDTAYTLSRAAHLLNFLGLHTGDQFAASDSDALDVCAAIYFAAENTFPKEFTTDEDASLRLIECSAGAMAAIRVLSDALDSEPCVDKLDHGVEVPNYIEHVSNWAATPGIGQTTPPNTSEVIGRILRAAHAQDQQATPNAA